MVRATLVGIACLSLCGCNDIPHAWSRNQISEIAADVAEDAAVQAQPDLSETADKITALEEANQELTQRIAALAAAHEELRIKHDRTNDALVEMQNEVSDLRRRLGMAY